MFLCIQLVGRLQYRPSRLGYTFMIRQLGASRRREVYCDLRTTTPVPTKMIGSLVLSSERI